MKYQHNFYMLFKTNNNHLYTLIQSMPTSSKYFDNLFVPKIGISRVSQGQLRDRR